MFKLPISLVLLCLVVLAATQNSNVSDNLIDGDINLNTSRASSEDNEISFGRRIIGGETAKPGQMMFVAHLFIKLPSLEMLECSSTVLSKKHILTAAHCVLHSNVKAISVLARILTGTVFTNTYFSSDEIYVHPGYGDDNPGPDHDIALLKLSGNKFMQNFGTPPLLPTRAIEDTAAIVAGWGLTSSDACDMSPTLQYAHVTTIPNALCNAFFGYFFEPTTICTLDKDNRICFGDSGGPLMKTRRGRLYVVGVSSFMLGHTCEDYAPSGYTDVLSYMPWIRSIL